MTTPPDATTHIAPCRPTVSCTADFANPGTLEVEVGYLFARDASYDTTRGFPFLIKLTLSKLLQIQVGSGNGLTFVSSPSSVYFDNLLTGLKLHVGDQGKFMPSFAVTALVSIPTHQYVGVILTGHLSKDIGPLHIDVNAGINEVGVDNSSPATQGFVAGALSATLAGPLGGAIETYYFSDGSGVDGVPFSLSHDGGLRMVLNLSPKPWLVFDAGGDIGYFPSVRAFSVFFGMSIAPVVFWR